MTLEVFESPTSRAGRVRRLWTSLLCLSAVTCLAIAGCSSSKDTGSGSVTSPGTSASSNVSGDPIRIGAVMGLSGVNGDPLFGKIASVWEKWTNAHGGLNGHPVDLTVTDDAGSPSTGLSAAKQLIQQKHVVAIVGSLAPTAISWLPYVSKAGVPVVGGSADLPGGGPYAFPASLSIGSSTPGTIDVIKKLGAKKVARLYCAELAQCSQGADAFKAAAGKAGMSVLTAPISSTAPDYTAPCLSAKSFGADLIVVPSSPTVFASLAKACLRNGYKGRFLAPGNGAPTWSQDSGLSGADIYSFNYVWNWNDTSTPAQKEYLQAIQQYAPSILTDPAYNGYVQLAWAGFQMFATAAKAGNIGPASTPQDVINALYGLHDETLGGLIGPVTFNKSDASHTSTCYYVNALKDGKWTDPLGSEPKCSAATTS